MNLRPHWKKQERKRRLSRLITAVLIFISSTVTVLLSEPPPHFNGSKYIVNYNPVDYDQQPQNWAIVQDKRGFIYVANQGGLLEYDGVTWRTIRFPGNFVRSLATTENGTICAGGRNQLGYLAPANSGSLEFVSLVPGIPESCRNFANVWKIHTTPEGVYFRTSKYLFLWRGKKSDLPRKSVKVFEAKTLFSGSFTCGDTLVVRQQNIGLMRMEPGVGTFILIPGGEVFKDRRVFTVMEMNREMNRVRISADQSRVLIGTRRHGFFSFNIEQGGPAIPFKTEALDYINRNLLYRGIPLSSPPGRFALATLRGGLVIIDHNGRLIDIFDRSSGLADNNIKTVFQDRRGNLWLGLDKGIACIDYTAPVSLFDHRGGLNGMVLSITRHGNALYAGTTSGLFVRDGETIFVPVPEIRGNCFSLVSLENSLLAATTGGVFEIKTNSGGLPSAGINRVSLSPAYVLQQSKHDKNVIWAGTIRGLSSIRLNRKKKQPGREFPVEPETVTLPIRSLAEDRDGNLWAGTLTRGVYHVTFSPSIKAKLYGQPEGLCTGGLMVQRIAGQVVFTSDEGLFRFDSERQFFIPYTILGERFAGGNQGLFVMVRDSRGIIWFHSKGKNYRIEPGNDGSYSPDALGQDKSEKKSY